jgi:acetyltransferase-like isoleucine patch superfamily enzyme
MKPQVVVAEQALRLILSPWLYRIARASDPHARQIEFQLASEFLSLWPFRLGMLARRVFYQRTLARCGANPVIRMGTVFVYPQAEIGNNLLLGTRCVIGLASIGDNVLFAHHVSVISGRHHHARGQNGNMDLHDGVVTRVLIGDNVWIGAGATVMADVDSGAIVGAGAVVVHPVPAGATVVGNPARVVGKVEITR